MQVITIENEAYQQILKKLDLVYTKMNCLKDKNISEWVDGAEVMKILSISSRTLQHYRDFGKLGFSQIGKKVIKYKRADVEALLNKNYRKGFGI
jgi:hypothetical protein